MSSRLTMTFVHTCRATQKVKVSSSKPPALFAVTNLPRFLPRALPIALRRSKSPAQVASPLRTPAPKNRILLNQHCTLYPLSNVTSTLLVFFLRRCRRPLRSLINERPLRARDVVLGKPLGRRHLCASKVRESHEGDCFSAVSCRWKEGSDQSANESDASGDVP